jgi:hypothetical protein
VLGILARVVRQTDAPVVVVDGEPSADSAPLAPSNVERVALDRLTILTKEKATELGIRLKEVKTGFRLEQSGPNPSDPLERRPHGRAPAPVTRVRSAAFPFRTTRRCPAASTRWRCRSM